ncbi:glycosyltransferase family 2 protein [Polynucleobacter paludilacus]|uniref:glycosyltransferase family 2 protein n=1 Tax=Polynucleobacter paludilacus TaxID=1855895 RepID=UPI001BFEC00E|nr:glycosyltransferase family 2 protein [Polynucleobacter paludilacus]QWD87305.1 glycosyltransferase family 2 protein [Polynucleobacter paludilacus]
MLVSVLINNYNYERFLAECIQSAISQSYPDVEIILVDDGSIDQSIKLAESFKGQIRVISQANGGQGSAYNTGFKEARGEILIFLDSDDLLLPNTIKEIVDVFKDRAITKVQWRLALIDDDSNQIGSLFPETLHDGDVRPIIKKFGNYASPPGSGNAYRRSALINFFPIAKHDWKIGADTLPALVAPFSGKVHSLKRYGGFYRIHHKTQPVNTFVMNNSPSIPSKAVELAVKTRNLVYEALSKVALVSEPFQYAMPAQIKLRLISLRVAPQDHPIPKDSRIQCLKDGLSSILCWPGFSPRKRFLYIAWMTAVALLPSALAKQVIIAGMNRIRN